MFEIKYELAEGFDCLFPFIDGEWIVATDGRIMARVPLAGLAAEESRRYERGTRRLIAPGRTIQVWDDAMPAARHRSVELPESVRDVEICSRCHPGADWEWPLIPPGKAWCEVCDGDGWYFAFVGIDLGGVVIGPRYAALLRRHGVSRVFPGDRPDRPVYFAGDGFEGILQPCYHPKYAHDTN